MDMHGIGRPVVRVAAAGALLLVVAGAGCAAVLSYRNGRAWEHRAGQHAARAEAAERQAGVLRGQLDESESRVDELQQRMSDLADEKASAEDEREILRVYAKRYRELTELAGGVSSELTSCIAELADAIAVIGNPYVSSSYFDQAVSDCEQALDNSQTLRALIADMPAPPGS